MNLKKTNIFIIFLIFFLYSCTSQNRINRIEKYDKSFYKHSNNKVITLHKFEFNKTIFNNRESIQTSRPLLTDNTVLVSSNGIFYKINLENGKITFKKKLPFKIIGNINLIDNKKLIFYASNQKIYLTDLNIEKIYAEYQLSDEEVRGDYLIIDNSIVFKTSKDRIYSVNKDNLNLNWVTKSYLSDFFPLISDTKITIDENKNIIAGFSNGKIAVFDYQTGKTLFEDSISSEEMFNDITSPLTLKENIAYIPSYKSGIVAFNINDKGILWNTRKGALSQLIFKNNEQGYYFSQDSLNLISLKNGKIIKKYNFEVNNPVKYFKVKNYIFVVSQDEGIYILDINNNLKVNKITVSSGISVKPLIKNKLLVLFTNNSSLYILRIK